MPAKRKVTARKKVTVAKKRTTKAKTTKKSKPKAQAVKAASKRSKPSKSKAATRGGRLGIAELDKLSVAFNVMIFSVGFVDGEWDGENEGGAANNAFRELATASGSSLVRTVSGNCMANFEKTLKKTIDPKKSFDVHLKAAADVVKRLPESDRMRYLNALRYIANAVGYGRSDGIFAGSGFTAAELRAATAVWLDVAGKTSIKKVNTWITKNGA